MGEMLTEGDLEFDFSAAILSERFDHPDTHKLSHCMKAVDFIVEWDREFWFVEVKNPSNSSIPPEIKRDKLNDFISKCKLSEKIRARYIEQNEMNSIY